MATGLTGAPVHAGSWFGLPDFGITEALQGQLTTSPSPTGLVTNTGAPAPVPNTSPVYGPAYNGPVQGPTYNGPQTQSIGQVAGASTESTPTSGGTDELTQQLDAIFNPLFSALQGQENTLNQNYAPVEGQIRAEGALSEQSLQNQYQEGGAQLKQEETGAGGRKEDALTSATRLYNELQRGGQQRFGGASSAGEAYQTLTAVEQQRRQGTIQSAYETAMQQITQFKTNLKNKFDTAVSEVKLQIQSAINDAQSQFRDTLQQIRSAQNQAQSDKAAASMNLLQDLRNKVYTINMQGLQFTQQLALNQQATQAQVKQYEDKVLQSVTGAQQTNTSFGNQAQTLAKNTNYGIGAPQPTTTPLQTGQITPRRPEELYA